MTLEKWWARKPEERYWMVAINEDAGEQFGYLLKAPHKGEVKPGEDPEKARTPWHYETVSETKPGDVVLCWMGKELSLVGWAEVSGPVQNKMERWRPSTDRNRAIAGLPEKMHWIVPLGGPHWFRVPLTRDVLSQHAEELLRLSQANKYPPFTKYRGESFRAGQSYLSKPSAELVRFLERLVGEPIGSDPRDVVEESAQDPTTKLEASVVEIKPRKRPDGGQGRQADPQLRKATEDYAMAHAVRYYREERNAFEIVEKGKPYDLQVFFPNGEELHVEVKGTTTDGAVTVELTTNEVAHARDKGNVTDLFVLDNIAYSKDDAEAYILTGGVQRVWRDWQPQDKDLDAIKFRYWLPKGS